jgi:putative transposase
MTNPYHFVVETADANLSGGRRQLNGVNTQRFNSRHGLVGHLFQWRIKIEARQPLSTGTGGDRVI